MELLLKREKFLPNDTIGRLFLQGSVQRFLNYTCEDVVRDLGADCSGKVYGRTAIPYGRYELILSYSNRFKKYLPLVLGVRCFDGIRMHGGNTAADSLGCILCGIDSDGKRIWNCPPAVDSLVNLLKKMEHLEKIFITITR